MSEDFWVERPVLVTGVAGFVGAHLARRLVDLRTRVSGIDLISSSPCLSANAVDVPVVVHDLAGDLPDLGAAEVIFHLAGQSHIAEAQSNPLKTWRTNVQGTWNLLEACRNLPAGQIQAVLAASSNHVYADARQHLVECGVRYPRGFPEDAACLQADAYGTSKAMVDALVRSYGWSGLPTASLRHVNAFGPADPHTGHIVIATILALLEGRAPIIRSDGTPTKGYLYVDRVVEAYLLLAEQLAVGAIPFGQPWNAAPDDPISVLALVDKLIQLAKLDVVPIILGEDRSQSGYVEHLDSSKLRALGWKAYGLEIGLYETFAWYKAHGGMAWAA